MIQNTLRYLFTNQYPYDDPFDQERAQAVLAVNWLIVFIWVIWGITALGAATVPYLPLLVVSVFVLSFAPLIFFSAKAGRLSLARNLTLSFLFAVSAAALYLLPNLSEQFVIVLILPLVLASILYNRQGVVLVGLLLAAMVFSIELLNIRRQLQVSGDPFFEMAQVVLILGIATFILAFSGGAQQQIAETALEEAKRLKAVIRIISRTRPETTQQQALQQALRFLRETYQYDFVQVYLADDSGQLSRRLRPGAPEIETLKGDDILPETSVLNEAVRTRTPVQASLSATPTRLQHLMPSIQRGVAIPIVHDDVTWGVLDLQQVRDIPITREELDTLSLIAAEVGSVLAVIEHNQALTRSLREQETLADRLQTQLSQLQAQRQQLIGSAWNSYLSQRGKPALGFDIKSGKLQRAEDMPAHLRAALQKREVFVSEAGEGDDAHQQINVPIVLRGEVLGAMTFAVPADQPVTDRQIELANTIALRLGSALESTRLLEQTQLQAQRERKASNIASTLITATDVETLLQLAADSFNNTLDAIQTQIIIEPRAFGGQDDGSSNGDRR